MRTLHQQTWGDIKQFQNFCNPLSGLNRALTVDTGRGAEGRRGYEGVIPPSDSSLLCAKDK